MINAIAKITIPLLLVSAVIANDDIEGAYERVSLTHMRTGESSEAVNRQGLLILAHGHYSMMTMNPDRRVPIATKSSRTCHRMSKSLFCRSGWS